MILAVVWLGGCRQRRELASLLGCAGRALLHLKASVPPLVLASALALHLLRISSLTLRNAHDAHHDQLHPRSDAADPGSGQTPGLERVVVRPRSRTDARAMAADDNPYPMRALAAQLRAIGDQGYALAEAALRVAEGEADRKR